MHAQVSTTALSGDSTVARLASLMESAASQRSRRDQAVEAFARWYTPAVVLGAAAIALIPSLVHVSVLS
jgi:Cd2+/Zn2+-exporting ATPase